MRRSGFTIIEAVVALLILTIVLGLAINYFVQQAELTKQTQARNEVQDKVRSVMQVVTQDLQLAGSSRYVDSSGNTSKPGNLSCSPASNCLSATSNGLLDRFTVNYVTSLQDTTNACRRVDYAFSGDTLRRSDLACGSDPATALADPANNLAENILAVDIQYQCSNGNDLNNFPDNTNCPAGTSYPRSAVVSIVGKSNNPSPKTSSIRYTTPTDFVNCDNGYVCYQLTQEVMLPNLKDQ